MEALYIPRYVRNEKDSCGCEIVVIQGYLTLLPGMPKWFRVPERNRIAGKQSLTHSGLPRPKRKEHSYDVPIRDHSLQMGPIDAMRAFDLQ